MHFVRFFGTKTAFCSIFSNFIPSKTYVVRHFKITFKTRFWDEIAGMGKIAGFAQIAGVGELDGIDWNQINDKTSDPIIISSTIELGHID